MTVTVTKERYIPMFEQICGELEVREELDEEGQWFKEMLAWHGLVKIFGVSHQLQS